MDNPDWKGPLGPLSDRDTQTWLKNGQERITERINLKEPSTKIAKNVVIFIGDGMSLATQMATRVHMGNENLYLSFEKWPYTGLSRVSRISPPLRVNCENFIPDVRTQLSSS